MPPKDQIQTDIPFSLEDQNLSIFQDAMSGFGFFTFGRSLEGSCSNLSRKREQGDKSSGRD